MEGIYSEDFTTTIINQLIIASQEDIKLVYLIDLENSREVYKLISFHISGTIIIAYSR